MIIYDELVQALVTIGNHETVKKECEPNVMQPLDLDEWMVKRALYALLIFQDTWDSMRGDKMRNG